MVSKTHLTGEKSINSSTSQNSKRPEEIDLPEIGKAIWQGRRLVAVITLIPTILALIASLTLPRTYLAEATILPTETSDASHALAIGLASQLGPAAGLLGGMGSRKIADLVVVLNSRRVAERVISRSKLDHELTGWNNQNDLVRMVMDMADVTAPTLKSKVIRIKVRAPEAELAAAICNAYVAELKEILDDIGYNGAKRDRQFIEAQLIRSKEDLGIAENKLAEFQAKNQLTSLPETITTLIQSIGDIEYQRTETTARLQSTVETLNLARSKVNSFQVNPIRVSELEIKQKSLLAEEQALLEANKQFKDRLSELPMQATILARLQRDVQVQNALYLALKQQHETALIDENRDSAAFIVLDHAAPPEKPIGPKHLQNVLLGLLVGLMAAIIAALVVYKPATPNIEAYKSPSK